MHRLCFGPPAPSLDLTVSEGRGQYGTAADTRIFALKQRKIKPASVLPKKRQNLTGNVSKHALVHVAAKRQKLTNGWLLYIAHWASIHDVYLTLSTPYRLPYRYPRSVMMMMIMTRPDITAATRMRIQSRRQPETTAAQHSPTMMKSQEKTSLQPAITAERSTKPLARRPQNINKLRSTRRIINSTLVVCIPAPLML